MATVAGDQPSLSPEASLLAGAGNHPMAFPLSDHRMGEVEPSGLERTGRAAVLAGEEVMGCWDLGCF